MKETYFQHSQEINKAKETLAVLEIELEEIKKKLQDRPIDADLKRELKRVMLDVTITQNELEHSESRLVETNWHKQHVMEK